MAYIYQLFVELIPFLFTPPLKVFCPSVLHFEWQRWPQRFRLLQFSQGLAPKSYKVISKYFRQILLTDIYIVQKHLSRSFFTRWYMYVDMWKVNVKCRYLWTQLNRTHGIHKAWPRERSLLGLLASSHLNILKIAMAAWTSHPPQEQKTRVRIPLDYKVFRKSIAMLLFIIDQHCLCLIVKNVKAWATIIF
jgi:hypothetical protein